MKKIIVSLVLISLLFGACKNQTQESLQKSAETTFEPMLKQYYEQGLLLDPIKATTSGDNRYDDLFTNALSLQHIEKQKEYYTTYLNKVNSYDKSSLTEEQQMSQGVLRWECERNLERLAFKNHTYFPIDQMWSPNLFFGQLASGASAQPFETLSDYKKWPQRVDGYLQWLDSAKINMQKGIEQGYVLPKSLIKKVIPQLKEMTNPVLEQHLFYTPVLNMPASFSVEDKKTALNMSLGSLLVYVAMELNSSEWVMPWIELGVGGGMLAFAHLSKRSNELVELALLEERATSERLLNNFLPEKIAKILRENGNKPPMIAERFDHVTVIFCDIVNFTPMSEKLSPEKLVAVLNQLFTEFDNLIEKYGLEKIKTIGDAYMVAGGVPNQMDNAEEASADFALEMLEVVKQFDRKFQHGLDMRIGMHCGPVVAGVIGKQKFTYDMWGDTVNVAARMESHGLPGEIHISEALADILKDKYLLAQRGWVEVKGKGLLQTFWIKQKEGGSSIASKHASKQPIASPNIDAKYTATKIDRDKDSVKKDAHRSSKTSQKSTSSPSPSSNVIVPTISLVPTDPTAKSSSISPSEFKDVNGSISELLIVIAVG